MSAHKPRKSSKLPYGHLPWEAEKMILGVVAVLLVVMIINYLLLRG